MRNHFIQGIVLSLLGTFFYACQAAVIKAAAINLPPLPVVIFGQSAFALLFMLPFIFYRGWHAGAASIDARRLPAHFMRAFFSLGISYFLFYAVQSIPLVNGMLLVNTSPLIVPLLACFFLGQAIAHRLWVPVLTGLSGVALVLHPSLHAFSPASLFALAAGVCMAASILSVRMLGKTENGTSITFWFLVLSTVISGIVALFFWQPMTLWSAGIIFVIGILYFLTQYTLASALTRISAQLVATLYYATVIYAAIISFFVWHVIPGMSAVAGILLVIGGGVLCILTERSMQQMMPGKNERGPEAYAGKN